MTKLKSADIKGILEEKGSNVFEVITEVPKDIFSKSVFEQANLVSRSIFGMNLETDFVKSIVFENTNTSVSYINIRVKIEISDMLISELANAEIAIQHLTKSYSFLPEPLTGEDAVEFAERGNTSFRIKIPFWYIDRDEETQRKFLADNIVEGITLEEFTFTSPHYGQDADPNFVAYFSFVSVPKLKDFVQELSILKEEVDTIYDRLSSSERLLAPLEKEGIKELAQKIIAGLDQPSEDIYHLEHEFDYLIETQYNYLILKKEEDLLEFLSRRVVSSTVLMINTVVQCHEVVGFNPISKNLIIRVKGYMSMLL